MKNPKLLQPWYGHICHMVPVAVPEVLTKDVLWNSVLETNVIPGSSSTGSGTGKWLLWCESASWQQVQVQSWSVERRSFIWNTPGLRAKTERRHIPSPGHPRLHNTNIYSSRLSVWAEDCSPVTPWWNVISSSACPVHVCAETKCIKPTNKDKVMFISSRRVRPTLPHGAKVSFVPNGSPKEEKNLVAFKLPGRHRNDGGRLERWSRPDLEAETKHPNCPSPTSVDWQRVMYEI